MKKGTLRNLLLWLVALLFVAIAAFTASIKLGPGFLLPSRFMENPGTFIASYAVVILLITCSLGCLKAGLKTVKEIKEEIDKISKD